MEIHPDKFSPGFEKFSCYIVAHADDWQLFLYPHVHSDIVEQHCKVIIIVTTAGDSGKGDQFWAAREEGSKSSIRCCLAPYGPVTEAAGKARINEQEISYWTANNTTTYFLRLPDGNLDGRGFSVNEHQCLQRFASGEINSVVAVDHSATYDSFAAITATFESIIRMESKGTSNRWLYYLNPDKTINSGDHPDHIATGLAIQNMSILDTLHQLLFVGYSSRYADERLGSKEVFWKTALFAAYEKAVYDLSGYSTLAEDPNLYATWCSNKTTPVVIMPVFEE